MEMLPPAKPNCCRIQPNGSFIHGITVSIISQGVGTAAHHDIAAVVVILEPVFSLMAPEPEASLSLLNTTA